MAASFAKIFGGPLHVVHAWELWGENLLRSRASAEEVKSDLVNCKRAAAKAVDRVIENSDLDGLTAEPLLGKGDPTRVVAGAIDMIKPGLVVMGSTAKEGILGSLLGNTAETIARQKRTSVLIVR